MTLFDMTGKVAVITGSTRGDAGMVVPPALGSSHAINFQPTGNGNATITGDFVALAKEMNPPDLQPAGERHRSHSNP